MTPNERIIQFLCSLPAPTAEVISLQIGMGFGEKLSESSAELTAVAITNIDPPIDRGNVARAAMVVGLIDFAFARPDLVHPERLKARALEEGDDHLMKLALGLPLARRYFEQARSEWRRLRATHLSLDALHEFELAQMAELTRKWQMPPSDDVE